MAPSARAGSIQTRDGKTIEGEVTPAGPSAVQVTPKGGSAVKVELSDVKRATFVEQPATTTPAGEWRHMDLGKVHVAGLAEEAKSEAGSTYKLTASGWGFWGPHDSGQVICWPFEGDGQIIAHVASHGDEHSGAMAGVMFRASTDADAPMAAAMVYPNGEARFVNRPVEGWQPGPSNQQQAVKYEWVRLTRNGDQLQAYKSKTGKFWEPISDRPRTVALGDHGVACLAVASGTNAYAAPATFDHVHLVAGPSGPAYFEGATGPLHGVVMTDGTMLAGYVDFIEPPTKVTFLPHFNPTNGEPVARPKNDGERNALTKAKAFLTLSPDSVARVRLSVEPPDLDHIVPPSATGVLTAGGDFMEAEVQRFSYGQWLDVNSVLFGAKRMDASKDCICVVLHDVKPLPGAYEVKTRDGSVIQASAVAFDGALATVDAPSVGPLKLPASELVSVEARK